MSRQVPTRRVDAAEARAYLAKAEEFLDASRAALEAQQSTAATSLAIHAAINAADVVTGLRIGQRASGPDHRQALSLLRQAGKDGSEVEKNLTRLLQLKTRTEYEPDAIALSDATRAVDRATRCVQTARRVAASA